VNTTIAEKEPAVAQKPVLPSFGRSEDWNLPEEPSPLRHPARLLAVAGAAVVVVAVVMPWVTYSLGSVHSSANGFTGNSWGIFALAIAGGLVLVLASRSAATSQDRLVLLLPALLGLGGLLIEYDARLSAEQLADSYRASGYSVSLSVGLEVYLLGSILCALGGLASSVMVWRATAVARRSRPQAAAAAMAGPGAGFVAELVVGALVSLACAIAGAVLALDLIHGNGEGSGLVALFSVLGIYFGAAITHALWRRFASHG
jgi:uncharacterized RDD family membrane protein YckC